MTAEYIAPRVLFRCDASMQIGGGHVMRCLTLAEALAAQGAETTFACTGESLQTVPALGDSGHPVMLVGNPLDLAEIEVSGSRWDAAIIDHYGLDAKFETRMRRFAPVILVIDDVADRPHDCDILLDQTLGRSAADYAPLIGPSTKLLLGPEFALLRPEFALARPAALAARAKGGPVRRILVSLGMTDIGGITAPVVKAVQASGLDAEIAVAIGSRATSLAELRGLAATDRRVVLHVDCVDMCTLMSESDITVGAGGTTSWERCCLGMPTLLIVIAENQSLIARNLEQIGAVEIVSSCNLDQVSSAVARLASDPARRIAVSKSAAAVCDGTGSDKVVRSLLRRLDGTGPRQQ